MCILSSFQSLLLIVEKFLMKCGFSYVLIGKDFLWFKLQKVQKGIQKEVFSLLVHNYPGPFPGGSVLDTCFSSK